MATSHEQPAKIGVLLAQRRPMDRLGLAGLLSGVRKFLLLGSSSSLNDLLQMCGDLAPDVVILDTGYPGGMAFEVAEEMRSNRWVQRILFLDDDISISRVQRVLEMPFASYYCKQSNFDELCRAICKLHAGEVTHDRALQSNLSVDKRKRRLRLRVDGPSIANLTPREIEVAKLLAEGNSVRDIAQRLLIAPSTIDNHKSRLMKKLHVHKVADLTRLAMRGGMVD